MRWLVLGVVVVVLVTAGLIDGSVSSEGSLSGIPFTAVTSIPSPEAETSSWYCTGGTGTFGSAAVSTLDLVNASGHAVRGSITVVNDAGASRSSALSLARRTESTIEPSAVLGGHWVAARVQLAGGGVLATESVEGPDGWSEAPCARTAASEWYFASGSTAGGSSLYASVFNPGATSAVVNFTFVTRSGVSQPMPFQGVVVPAGKLVTEPIGQYVQDASSVSTVVQAISGRIVADQLQTVSGSFGQGLSLQLGSPSPSDRWAVARSIDLSGSTTNLNVFNPSDRPEAVTVAVRLPSGPVAPLHRTVAAESTWELTTSGVIRIPLGVDYSMAISARGAGVVVDRSVLAPGGSVAPEWGAVPATPVPAVSGAAVSLLATPGTGAAPAVGDARLSALDLLNPGTRSESVSLEALTPRGDRPLPGATRLVLGAGAFVVLGPATLSAAGSYPLLARSSREVLVAGDFQPAGCPGAVGLVASTEAG